MQTFSLIGSKTGLPERMSSLGLIWLNQGEIFRQGLVIVGNEDSKLGVRVGEILEPHLLTQHP